MTWSLQLHNGDFAVTGAQFGTVTNEQKLTQDLRCALLEAMGTDDMHPDYGSLIDGGTLPDGTTVPGVIGLLDINQVAATVQSEIERIAQAYQNQQLNRAKSDRLTYNRVSLSPAEVLLGVGLTLTQQEDTLLVNIALSTARGDDINIALPILTTT